MTVEARISRINPEIAGLRPGLPHQTSPDQIRRNRFSIVPVSLSLISGSETMIPGLRPENTLKLILKEKPLHDKIGNEPYNPRKKSYHDEKGKLIIRRRGRGGGGRCAKTNHDEFPCPTPTRCQKAGARLKSTIEARSNRMEAVATNTSTLRRPNIQRSSRNEAPKRAAA